MMMSRVFRSAPALDGGKHLQLVGYIAAIEQDYEYLTQTSETLIYIAMSRPMVRRLAKKAPQNLNEVFLEHAPRMPNR